MRAGAFLGVLSVVVLSVFVLVSGAQANLEAVYAVDNLFTAVNSGELDAASAMFSADAVASYAVTDQWYEGSDEIGIFLEGLHGEDRAYEIVQIAMTGDTVDLTLDVADHGHVWGQLKLTSVVHDGRIEHLEVVETRLMLWRVSG
ncbi:MAG: nuclear transport factor 2 family protein [Candidatus Promineifilaceae bacterium]|nr:nuclear transport factor 2 family protein [Candidatus Promineifilaceae bacterium]